MQETNSCLAHQHRSRNYLIGGQSANGGDPRIKFMGHSHWRVRTMGRLAAMSQTKQARETSWTQWFIWRFRFFHTERAHFQHASVSVCFWRQRSCDQTEHQRLEPQHGTRFQNPRSWSWLVVRSHHDEAIQVDCWCVNQGFFFARTLDTLHTLWLECHNKRIDAHSMVHLFFLETACLSDQQKFLLNKSRQSRYTVYFQDESGGSRSDEKTMIAKNTVNSLSGETAWENPTQSTWTQRERTRSKIETSAKVSWTSINWISTTRWQKKKDVKDHIIQHWCSKYGKYRNKLANFFSEWCRVQSMFMNDCVWSVFSSSEEGEKFQENSGESSNSQNTDDHLDSASQSSLRPHKRCRIILGNCMMAKSWQTKSWNDLSLLESQIGRLFRTDVHVLSDSVLLDASANEPWATKPSEEDRMTVIDRYDITGRRVQFHWRKFSGHSTTQIKREKFKHCWEAQIRVISKVRSNSCQCWTTLNIWKMSKHVLQTQQWLPNTRSNSS